MKSKLFMFCLVICILFSTSYTAFANDKSEGIVYNINIYINGDLQKTHTQTLYEEWETPNSYNYGEFVKDKSNATINGKSALLFYHDSNFEVFNRSTFQYPVAGDEIIVNLYYQVEEEEPEELIYGTAILNISDGSSPIEGYSITFNGKKGYKEDSVTGISNSEGKVIVKLDESYEWEYSVDGSTWDVNFENHVYRNDISLQKELEPKEIEYDGQNYNVDVTLQFNEEAGGTLVDGLTDSTDIIEKSFIKKSGTAITYKEIISDLEKEDKLVIHNDKLYRSSSVYVSAKDSVNTKNNLVNHGEYIVTNANTTITIQFIYVKDIEPADDPTPEPEPTPDPVQPGDDPVQPGEDPVPAPEPTPTPEPAGTQKDTPTQKPTPTKSTTPIKVKQTPIEIIEYYTTKTYEAPEIAPIEKEETAEEISKEGTPLGLNSHKSQRYWALVNLIEMIITVIISVVLILRFLWMKWSEDEDDEEEKRNLKLPMRLISILVAVIAFIFFVITENIFYPMIMVDKYTFIATIILIIQLCICIFARATKDDDDDEIDYE